MEVSARGTLVRVDVNIDYSKRTMMTKGVVKTNRSRFSTGEKVRFVDRDAVLGVRLVVRPPAETA